MTNAQRYANNNTPKNTQTLVIKGKQKRISQLQNTKIQI